MQGSYKMIRRLSFAIWYLLFYIQTFVRMAWRVAYSKFAWLADVNRGSDEGRPKRNIIIAVLLAITRRVYRRIGATYAQVAYLHKAMSSRALRQLVDSWLEKLPVHVCSEVLRQYADQTRADPYVLVNVVVVLLKMLDIEGARKYSNRLLREHPESFGEHQQAAVWFFIRGHYNDAENIWSQTAELKELAIEKEGLNQNNLRLLGPSWLLAIGHIAHIDIYIKNKILNGQKDQKTIVVLPYSGKVPNRTLLNCWKRYVDVSSPNLRLGLNLRQIELLQDEFWSLRLSPGQTRMFSHAGAIVQRAWEDRGLPPLLSLEAETEASGWAQLEAMGLPRDSWFVCLHVREAGFHRAWHEKHPSTRNADVLTYTKAVRTIIDHGGYVVRMGDSTMTPMPETRGLIDYALSGSKSEAMDIFLCAKARFFIGTNSGLGLVPPIFGVPCAMTNWSPIALPQWYLRDRFIPKRVYSRALKRFLTFAELFSTPAGWEQFREYFETNGLDVIDNTAEEINTLVLEMLEELNGGSALSELDKQLLQSYNYLVGRSGSYVGARIGLQFLREAQAEFNV